MDRHLRSIPHTGTRALNSVNEYKSVKHVGIDQTWDEVVIAGEPTDVPIRDPKKMAISTAHHVVWSRLSWYRRLYELRTLPNVRFVKIEDTGIVHPESATADHLGLRERYAIEPFPEHFLAQLGDARVWLRDEFGYEGL